MSPLHHARTDPRKPHGFVARSDPGLAAMASGGGGPQRPVGPVAVTSGYIRELEACAVEGCGRPRTDDIHATAGE